MVNTIKGPLKPNTEIQVISKNLIALAARNIKNILESVDYLETVNNCLHIENTKCCFVMAYSSTHLQLHVLYIGLTVFMSFYYNELEKDFTEVTPCLKCFHISVFNNTRFKRTALPANVTQYSADL